MTIWTNPPVFRKGKSYERFKQELLAWRKITDLRLDKQGIAVALSLPEDDKSKIQLVLANIWCGLKQMVAE